MKAIHTKAFYDVVFEWEDIFAKQLLIPMLDRTEFEVSFDKKCRNLYKKQKFSFLDYIPFWIIGGNIFMYDMSTKRQDGIYNASNYIPCLIDFFGRI